MSTPPQSCAPPRSPPLRSPFSPRGRRTRAAAGQPRPQSTAALLDSADDGDDEDHDADDVTADPTFSPPPEQAAPPPAKKCKGKRKQSSRSEQQGPKYSDSGGGATAASGGSAGGGSAGDAGGGSGSDELVLSANSILESLARLRDQCEAKAGTREGPPLGPPLGPDADADLDDNPRLYDDTDKQEAESWRFRRRKAVAGSAMGGGAGEASRSYHRDYQEALQSLLWEPYDCRDPKDTPMYQYADDADVSLWLYSRPGHGPGSRRVAARGGGARCHCPCRCELHHSPGAASSSDCSSSASSDSFVSPPPAPPLRETSASSLRGLLTASTSGGSSVAEGSVWTSLDLPGATPSTAPSAAPSAAPASRGRRHRDPPRLVTDLKTPWVGVQADAARQAAAGAPQLLGLSLRAPPPAALAALSSAAAAGPAALRPAPAPAPAPARQSETGRAGRRTFTPAPGSASYGHRPTMLVNVSEDVVSPSVVPGVPPVTTAPSAVSSVSVSSVTVSGVSQVWAGVSTVCSEPASVSVSSVSVPVPSPSVSAVPTIACLNNVSNVHILPTAGAPSPTPRPRPRAAVTPTPTAGVPLGVPPPPQASPRTYASTEAQTDDLEAESRRERRRERRERRHLRRLQPRHPHPHPAPPPPGGAVGPVGLPLGVPHPQTTVQGLSGEPAGPGLPDILHAHLPPPYTTLPLGLPPHMLAAPAPPPPLVAAPPPQLSPPPQGGHHRFAAPGLRLPFAFVPATRRR